MKNITRSAVFLLSMLLLQHSFATNQLVKQKNISATNIDMRSSGVVVLDSIVLNAPENGRVVVRLDGYCVSDSGDRIVLAASNEPRWFANDGNVAVNAPHTNFKRRAFSHTRVYDVTAGLDTFYAVGQNYVDEDGSGIASVYAHLTLEYFPASGDAMVISADMALGGDVRSAQKVIAKIYDPAEPAGKVFVHADGCVNSSPGDRIMLSVANIPSWLVGDGSVALMALNANQTQSPYSHSRVYTQNTTADTFYTTVRNVVNTSGSGVATVYGNLSATFYPSSGQSFIQVKEIEEDDLNARGAPVAFDSITITTTTPGYALAQLDGYCTSSVGDEMLFAVNNVPAWGPNEDHITVSAAYTNNNFSTLAHSRLFYIPAGTHTYYSVVQNFSSSAGNGLVDIMANFTVKFYPDESVGIAETSGNIVAVYPNPVSGILTIALPNNNSRQTVTITDLSGRIVQNMETTNQQLLQVDMSYLPAGVYIVKGNGFVKKVIKQ